MSLQRLVFYCAMFGGWAALLGWMLSEIVLLRRSSAVGFLAMVCTAALVGAAIGGSLTLLGGLASGTLRGQLHRLWPGLIGGFLSGALGSLVGNLVYLILPRFFGWMIMGLAIGSVEGLYDRSQKKIRNGLIGGGLGGLLGGLLFDPVSFLIGSDMSSRAVAFVVLGMCIGLFIGLAQVVLKEAWLTVEQGFRPGRQLILDRPVVQLGTSEKAELPFIAIGARGVEPIHLRIVRQPDGSYMAQDNASRGGTFVNGKRLQQPVLLRNNDLIQLGPNVVRFQERYRAETVAAPLPAGSIKASASAAMPVATAWTPAQPASTAPTKSPAPPPPPGPAAVPLPVGKPVSSPPAPAAKPSTVPAKPCPLCNRKGSWKADYNKFFCSSCGVYF